MAVNIHFQIMTGNPEKVATEQRDRPETDKIGQEFDQDACNFCDRYRRKGLSRSSRLLLDFIRQEGTDGRSVVDLGCGTGGFTIEVLKQGAQTAIGVDLSSNMIDSANKLAIANRFADRAKFQVANAATAELPASDIVVMDKVLCCYSDWKPLLGNAMNVSRTMIGFIVPRDEGIAKIPFRVGIRIINYFSRKKGSILFYLHPLKYVDETLRGSGFTHQKKKSSGFWLVFLYARAESNDLMQSR